MQKRAAILTAFNPRSYKGGIETFLLNLKTLLEKNGFSVDFHYISPSPTLPLKPFPLKAAGKVIPEFLLNCFMLGRAFSKIEKNYDIVISNNFYGLGYYSPKVKSFNIYHSTHAGYADALKGKVSGTDYRNLKYLFGHLGDRLSGRGKSIIAVSKSVKDELERYYGFKDVSVVNHGIDADFYKKIEDVESLRCKWNIPAGAFTGIFAGRWETGKGIDIIEEAVKVHQDITWLLVVGNSECPLSGYNNVKVIKDAEEETLKELYSLSDFMLFPSYYEGFGLVVAEAMSCGLPVICTEVGLAKDLLRFSPLKRLIIPACGKQELIKQINERILFLKGNPCEKNGIAGTGRFVTEKDYSAGVWEEKMAAALGLPLQ